MLGRMIKSAFGLSEVRRHLSCRVSAHVVEELGEVDPNCWLVTRCRRCRLVTLKVCPDCFRERLVPLLCTGCFSELSLDQIREYKWGGHLTEGDDKGKIDKVPQMVSEMIEWLEKQEKLTQAQKDFFRRRCEFWDDVIPDDKKQRIQGIVKGLPLDEAS